LPRRLIKGRPRTRFGSRGLFRVCAPCRGKIDKGLFLCLKMNKRGPPCAPNSPQCQFVTGDTHPNGRSPMSSAEERETINRALTGDQTAFRSLYVKHRDRITATVAQRTKDPDDIDDLVQMSFIRAFSSLKNFRCESAFSTWLTRIALNVCITHHQTRRITLPESVLDTEAHHLTNSKTPEDEFHTKERWNTLLRESRIFHHGIAASCGFTMWRTVPTRSWSSSSTSRSGR
jgi:hypothetical protein